MNGSDDDIRWLGEQRPGLDPPDPEASRRARAAVMSHATRSVRLAPVVAAPRAARSRRSGIGVLAGARRAVAMAAAVATVATAGVVGTLVVSTGAGPHSVLSPGVADAQSLVLLANHVATAPLKGDATLVFHGNSAKSEKPFTGADLYLDNGRYYYAMTPAGLPAAIKAGPQDYTLKPMIMAMSRVSSSDPQVARDAFLKAADPEWGGNIQHSPTATQDNVIWVSGIDVLGAGYGRPAVLAGMLRALATVHGVSVTHSHLNGAPTLEISMYVPRQTTDPKLVKRAIEQRIKAAGGHITRAERTALAKLAAQGRKLGRRTIPAHFMRATVDANTGALLRYTDIGLVVTYHVSRVDVAKFGGR